MNLIMILDKIISNTIHFSIQTPLQFLNIIYLKNFPNFLHQKLLHHSWNSSKHQLDQTLHTSRMFRSRRSRIFSRITIVKWSREKFWDRESNLFTVYKHVHNDTWLIHVAKGKSGKKWREKGRPVRKWRALAEVDELAQRRYGLKARKRRIRHSGRHRLFM